MVTSVDCVGRRNMSQMSHRSSAIRKVLPLVILVAASRKPAPSPPDPVRILP